MSEDASILVLGLDELGSAIARRLHLAGHAVAIHQPAPPYSLRRRMSFVDAWTDGACTFEGVEARRADKTKDFLAFLKNGAAIPVLWHPFEDIAARWPWDVIVDARTEPGARPERLRALADMTIGVGAGYVAGVNCDVVIDSGARDPGGVVRQGPLPATRRVDDRRFADGSMIAAPERGLFRTTKQIGEAITAGDAVGSISSAPIVSPQGGRIRGLARDGAAVARGADLCEIVAAPAEVAGIARRDRLIARSVAFVIEMERSGFEPISFENFF